MHEQHSRATPRDLTPPHPHLEGPVFDITGLPLTAAEVDYRQRAADLARTEQALLALRAQQALQAAQHPHAALASQPGATVVYPAPAAQAIPARAKTYAVVASSTGVAVAGGGWGLTQAAPALASLAQITMAGAGIVTAVVFAFLVLRFARPAGGQGGTEVHVHRGAKVRVKNLHIR